MPYRPTGSTKSPMVQPIRRLWFADHEPCLPDIPAAPYSLSSVSRSNRSEDNTADDPGGIFGADPEALIRVEERLVRCRMSTRSEKNALLPDLDDPANVEKLSPPVSPVTRCPRRRPAPRAPR